MCARRFSNPRAGKSGIVQIAAALGVSPSTVSRALRPETAKLVSPEQRKRILELADKQRFSPNPGARMLRRGFNATLSVVVPLDENIFFSEFYGRFLSGTLHAAGARGWDVHICTLRQTADSDFRETLQHSGVGTSGIIYLAEPLSDEQVQSLRGYRRPLVITKSALPPHIDAASLGMPVVGVDNVTGAQSAIALLLQLGHRRIGLLLGPSSSRDAHERRQGYVEVLERAGLMPPAQWIYEGTFSAETGRNGLAAMLAAAERPTAVCCASDEIAFGALDAARAAGLRCPEDLSVIGFDDGPLATACRPALTTIRQPLADLAERAVGLIVEASNTATKQHRAVTSDLPAGMVIRESTRAIVRAD